METLAPVVVTGHGLGIRCRAQLEKGCVEGVHQRYVKAVEPQHRLVSAVASGRASSTGGSAPRRRVACRRHHRRRSSRPLRLRARSAAHRRVAMGGCPLVTTEILHGGPKGRRRVRQAIEAGVGQGQDPTIAASLDRDQLSPSARPAGEAWPTARCGHGSTVGVTSASGPGPGSTAAAGRERPRRRRRPPAPRSDPIFGWIAITLLA